MTPDELKHFREAGAVERNAMRMVAFAEIERRRVEDHNTILKAENAKLKKENADLTRLANMLTKLVFETSRCPSTSCVDCEVYELCGECVYLQGLYGIDKDLACDVDTDESEG